MLLDFSSPSHSSPEPELELLLEEDDLDLEVIRDGDDVSQITIDKDCSDMVMRTVFYTDTFLLATGWLTLREHFSVSWPSAGNSGIQF